MFAKAQDALMRTGIKSFSKIFNVASVVFSMKQISSRSDGNSTKIANALTADARTSGSSSPIESPDSSEIINICLSR